MENQPKKIIGLSETEVSQKGDAVINRLETAIERRLITDSGNQYTRQPSPEWDEQSISPKDLCLTEEELQNICARLEALKQRYRQSINDIFQDSETRELLAAILDREYETERKKVLSARLFIPAGVDQNVAMAKLTQNIFSPDVDETSRIIFIEWCKDKVYMEALSEIGAYMIDEFSPAKLCALAPADEAIRKWLNDYCDQCNQNVPLSAMDLIKGMAAYLKLEISYQSLTKKAGVEHREAKKILDNLRKMDPSLAARVIQDEIVRMLTDNGSPLREICIQMQRAGIPAVAEAGNAHLEKAYYIHLLLAAMVECGEIGAIRSAENFGKFVALVEDVLSVMPYLSLSEAEEETEIELQTKFNKIYRYLAERVQKTFNLKRLCGVNVDTLQISPTMESLEKLSQRYFNDGLIGKKEEEQIMRLCTELFEKYPDGDFSDLTRYEEFNEFTRSLDHEKCGGLQVIQVGLIEKWARSYIRLVASVCSADNSNMCAGLLLGISAREIQKDDRLSKIGEAILTNATGLISMTVESNEQESKLLNLTEINDASGLLALADSLRGDPREDGISAELRQFLERIRELKEKIHAINGRLVEIFSASSKAGEKAEIRQLITAENQAAGLLQTLLADVKSIHQKETKKLLLESREEWRHKQDVMEYGEKKFKQLIQRLEEIQEEFANYLDE